MVEDGQFTPDSSDSLYMETGGPSEGWHFVSFMVHPYNTSISYLLDNESGGIPGSYDKVMYYSAGSDEWMTYLPYRDTHYNDLHTWNNSMGLWIHMISNDTLYVNGTTPTTTDITLYPGWNMVGYPSEVGSTLPSEVSKIGVYEPENEYNLQYIYDLENYTLGAYNGYWVYNSADHNVVWSVEYLG